MPGLVACNRRWEVGSDDFVFPALVEVFIRAVWLIALAVVYSIHQDGLGCRHGHQLEIYYIGMLAILSLHIIIDVVISIVSAKGTIVDGAPRRKLPCLLYLKIPLLLVELAWTIMGTIWAFTEADGCEWQIVLTMRAAVIAGWLILIVLTIGLFVVFDPVGHRSTGVGPSENTEDLEASSAAKRLWELRCKLICCCAATDEHSTNAFSDIAEIISDYFKGLDIVPTDIAAGLILLQMEQKKQPNRLRLVPMSMNSLDRPTSRQLENVTDSSVINAEPRRRITDSDSEPSTSSAAGPDLPYPRPQDWMTLTLAAHYMKFAGASYGWPFYMYSNLCCGLCKLCRTCRCCDCCRTSSITEDNCCGCNSSAILQTTDIKEEDIIYASFYNRVYEIPFFVALDHNRRAVVVAVRGTLSLKDALTDMTAESDPLDSGRGPNGKAHRGILRAARFIQNTLKNLLLLQTAFDKVPDYKLVVTGHSLGAGAAAILAILLRPEYPDLTCFAFSPPGWLLSKELSRYTEDFIMSVVVGKDLVPRLGFINMEQLKSNVLKVVRDSNRPKYRILMGGAWYTVFGYPAADGDVESAGTRHHLISGARHTNYTEEQTNLELLKSCMRTVPGILSYCLASLVSPILPAYNYKPLPVYTPFVRSIDDAIMSSSRTRFTETQLFMPGHVLYVDEREAASSCFATPTYEAAWARSELFDEIIVSPQMVSDHLPDVVSKALEQLVNRDASPRFVVRHTTSPVNV